ncbi:MAG: hypothetical protein JXB50_12670 [Spirochaetes bacterium]|nr:hypothetical protein [Spirochaetota bacterium]
MKKNYLKTIMIFVIILINFSNCVIINELIPKPPTDSVKINDISKISIESIIDEKDIGFEYSFIEGYKEPHTPSITEPTKKLKDFLMELHGDYDLNKSGIAKYYNKKNKDKPKSIIIMIPGIYSAAGTLSNLGLSIARRLPQSEVWIWERRANLLEDRRLLKKAIKEKNSRILLELYENDKFKLKQNSFYQPSTEDISFLSYWGFNVLMNDLYKVIIDARTKSDEIVLCGYSLGVLYAANFLANDFGESNTFGGHNLIDRVIFLDGPPMIHGYVKNEQQYFYGVTIIPYNIIEGKKKLESGKYYPCSGTVDRDMSFFFNVNARAILAYIAPNELSHEQYDAGLKKLPVTNLAKHLLEIDDNYQKFKLFTATFGRADAKNFGKFSYNNTVKVTGLAQNKKFIDWIPYTHFENIEFNNYNEYLKAECNEHFNMEEWYQPTRILLDFGSIHHNDTSSGWQSKYFKVTENKNIKLPFLCVGLSRGLSSRIEIYKNYKEKINSNDFTIIMVDQITHLDGDTVTDNGSRPVIADITANWLNKRKIYNQ